MSEGVRSLLYMAVDLSVQRHPRLLLSIVTDIPVYRMQLRLLDTYSTCRTRSLQELSCSQLCVTVLKHPQSSQAYGIEIVGAIHVHVYCLLS